MMSGISDEKISIIDYSCIDRDNGTLKARNTPLIGPIDETCPGTNVTSSHQCNYSERSALCEIPSNRNSIFSKFWRTSEKSATVIYENICRGCRYGIFGAKGRYCNFCQFVLNGNIQNQQQTIENIYENICIKCGRIYSSDIGECEQCSIQQFFCTNFDSEVSKNAQSSQSIGGVFRDLFGTLKKGRSRNTKLQPRDANKHRKLQIIHNVRTNEDNFGEATAWVRAPLSIDKNSSIELNRTCEADHSTSHNKNNNRRIYGKLRKSDDHLMNSLRTVDHSASSTHSYNSENVCKSDPNINNFGLCLSSLCAVVHSDDPTLDTNSDCECTTTLLESTATIPSTTIATPARSPSSVSSFFMVQDNVVEWLTSLRRQTHDYCPQFAADDSISNIKSIPSQNFNCCGFLWSTSVANLVDVTSVLTAPSTISLTTSVNRARGLPKVQGRSVDDFDYVDQSGAENDSLKSLLVAASNQIRVDLMIDNFKRHLMEKRLRSKRRAIYVKVDESDDNGPPDSAVSTDGLVVNASDQQSRRNAFHERNSDFVNDILIAFDTFLNRESESNTSTFSAGAVISNDGCNTNSTTIAHAASSPLAETQSDCVEVPASQHQQQAEPPQLVQTHKSSGKSQAQIEQCADQQIGPVVASLVIARGNVSPTSRRRHCKCEILRSLFHQADAFIRPAKLRNLLTTIEVSKSLNRRLFSLESNLRTFLSAISGSAYHSNLDQSRLIEMYAMAAIMLTSTSSAANKKSSSIGPQSAITSGDKSEDNKSDNSDITTQSLQVSRAYDDDIYQPIWKFRTIGNPRESYTSMEPTDDLPGLSCSLTIASIGPNDSSSLNVEDLSDWETDDEFVFTVDHSSPQNRLQQRASPQQSNKYLKINKNPSDRSSPVSSPRLGERIRALKTSILKPHSSSQSLASVSSTYSADSVISTSTNCSAASPNWKRCYGVKRKYQRICILFSYEDPRLRAIDYNYGDNRQILASHFDRNNDSNNSGSSGNSQLKRQSTSSYLDRGKSAVPTNEVCKWTKETAKAVAPTSTNYFIPSSVQSWKYALLDVNCMEDEEDMYVSRDEIFSTYREEDLPPTTLKKCASEGNLLQIPPDKKKTFGERFINKFQAVGIFPISPRQMKDKKKLDYFKRRGSIGLYFPNPSSKVPIFGTQLEQVQLSGITNVPEFVVDCINIIERAEFISTDGLYRASGNKVEIDVLKKNLTEKYDAKILENQDIHTITGLLKLFFRELKSALISDDVYNKLPDSLVDKENLSSIKNVLYLMSCVSRDTLKYLIKHLTKVAAESHTNRMPASNLAIIWGPCILYSSFTHPMSIARINTLTKVLIEQYDIIFNEDERLV